MALNGLGIDINGQSSNPQVLNNWLMDNGGYTGNNLYWGKISEVADTYSDGLPFLGKITSVSDMITHLCDGDIVALNVKNGGHWVLAVDYDSDNDEFIVHDPGYYDNPYPSSEVTQAALYDASYYPVSIASKMKTISYPSYSSCDSRWKDETIGSGTSTICASGSLVVSLSIALESVKVAIDGSSSTPSSLNTWLNNNNGYTSTNLFIWTSIETIQGSNGEAISYIGKQLSYSTVLPYIGSPYYLCIVRDEDHFNYGIGVSSAGYRVFDPYSNSVRDVSFENLDYVAVYNATDYYLSSNIGGGSNDDKNGLLSITNVAIVGGGMLTVLVVACCIISCVILCIATFASGIGALFFVRKMKRSDGKYKRFTVDAFGVKEELGDFDYFGGGSINGGDEDFGKKKKKKKRGRAPPPPPPPSRPSMINRPSLLKGPRVPSRRNENKFVNSSSNFTRKRANIPAYSGYRRF